jgi:hypothetical protein
MKTIKIPFVPELNGVKPADAANIMETRAQRISVDTINWEEYPYKPIVAVDAARSSDKLFLRYFVKGNSIKAIYKEDDSPVHTDSCVEFFVKKPESDYYFNFEFNCIGTCDCARRKSRKDKVSLTSEEYASIERYSTLGDAPFEEKKGIHAWELIVAIPFETIDIDPNNLPEKLLGNFYKCADDTENPHFVSWNPIETSQPDFHRPEFFGEIYL